MSETTTVAEPLVVEEAETKPGFAGQNVPRKEDRRLVQGEGVFVDDVKRHNMGYVHFVRSPYAHAKIRSVDVSKALEHPGVLGTLTGDEVALLTDPFFQISSPPGRAPEGLRLAVGKARFVGEPVVAVVADDARARPRRRRARRGRLRAAAGAHRRARGARPTTRRSCTTRPATNLTWEGVYEWGDLDEAFAEADQVVQDLASSTSTASTRRRSSATARSSSTTAAPAQWTIITNNQFPGLRRDHDGPGDAGRARQAPLRHAGHRRRLRQQDHLAPAARRLLPARPQAEPARAVDRVAHRLPPLDVARQRALVPGHRGRGQGRRHAARLPHDGARRRGRVAALRAARRRHLGAGDARDVPLAQHPRRLHAGRDEQGAGARRTAATRACSTSGSPSA